MKKYAAFFLALLVSLTAYSNEETDNLYNEAERAYLKGDVNQSLSLLGKFFSSSEAEDRMRVKAHNLNGLIHFQLKKLSVAVDEFEKASQLGNKSLGQSDSVLHLARYNLGNALFQNSRPQEAADALKSVKPEALDADTRMRFFHLLGNVSAGREDSSRAMMSYLQAANLAKDPATRDAFLQKALNSSKKVFFNDPKSDIGALKSLDIPSDSPSGYVVRYLVARGQVYLGDADEANSILKTLLSSDPEHPFRPKVLELLSDLEKLSGADPHAIGVLLPLSGKFGKFGRLCLNAIMMALNAFEDMPALENSSKLHLVIRDSGDSPESALAAFEALVKEEKAIAVIGPLLSKQFAVVARKAQEFGTPLLSLSQRVETESVGSFIFPVALSPEHQIRSIVKQAIAVNGYKRFAILAPSDSFGNEYVDLFWNEVEALGGEVVGYERYTPKSTDFREEINRLLGLEYLGARRFELEDLKRRETQYASTLKVKGRLRQRLLKAYEPKAVVDFDAIFIPDDPATIGQIAPSFAVKDATDVPMLGINTWNTPEIVQRAGRYLQKSIFVDGFFAGSKRPETVKFVTSFSSLYETVPGTIEAQAYDAALILVEVLGQDDVSDRLKLRSALLEKRNFTGISGKYEILPSGIRRDALLLTVNGYNIEEIPNKQGL